MTYQPPTSRPQHPYDDQPHPHQHPTPPWPPPVGHPNQGVPDEPLMLGIDEARQIADQAQPRRLSLAWVIPATTVALLVVYLAGWFSGSAYTESSRNTKDQRAAAVQAGEQVQRLTAARTACLGAGTGIDVADGGRTLTVDSAGSKSAYSGADVTMLDCVLSTLKTPDAVKQHMMATRALDGRQTDTWEVYTASWSYHPDNGLDLIVQVK